MLRVSQKRPLALFVTLAFLFYCFEPLGLGVYAAEAEMKRTIAVLAFNPAMSEQDRGMLKDARNRVAKTKKFSLVSGKDIADYSQRCYSEGDPSVRKTLEEASGLVVRGKELYDRLEFSESVSTLKMSLKRYRDAFPYLKDASDMIRGLIYLGMAYITMNDIKNGQRYITESLRMDPERRTRKLSESLFPPNIRAIYKARQDFVAGLSAGSLTVTCTPPGGMLFINGFKVGEVVSQRVVDDLPPGKHFVMVEKIGYSKFFEEIDLGNENVSLNAVMDKWDGFAEVDIASISDVKRENLKNVSRDLGADVLLLGSIANTGEEEYTARAQLFDSKDGTFSRVEEERFTNLEKSWKYFGNVVGGLLKKSLTSYSEVISYSYEGTTPIVMPVERTPETEDYGDRGGGGSIFSKWWFWTIIGGAALAAGGGVLLFTDILKSDPSYNLVKINR